MQQFGLYDPPHVPEGVLGSSIGQVIKGGAAASRRQPRGSALGLSKAQILTLNNTVTIYGGGARVTLPRQRANARVQGGGVRRQCVGMTKDARRSASKLFQSIDRKGIAATWFITCTLPADEVMSVKQFHVVLHRYFERMNRAWGTELAWYWAIEPTAAGQWHVHMIAMWVRITPEQAFKRYYKFIEWNDRAWAESTGLKHRIDDLKKAACNVQGAKHWGGVMRYLSGYLSPEKWAGYTGGPTGRVHGCRNRRLLPINPENHVMSERAIKLMRRQITRIHGRRKSGRWLKCKYQCVHRLSVKRLDLANLQAMFGHDSNKLRAGLKAWKRQQRGPGAEWISTRRCRGHFTRPILEKNDEEIRVKRGRGFIRYTRETIDVMGYETIGISELRGFPADELRRLAQWAIAQAADDDAFDSECPI